MNFRLRRSILAFGASLAVLAAGGEARAQATLLGGLGGPAGYGSSCVPACDDCSWPQDAVGLDITPAFPNGLHFYAGTYKTAWVNNNGNVSFQSSLSAFTPNAFPGAGQPMIAPFWADVDTTPPSACDTTLAACTNPTTDGVWWSLQPGQFVVTWDHVGSYPCQPTPSTSFQVILTSSHCGDTGGDGGTGGTNFDIEFRYAECGWEVGGASGGSGGFCPAGDGGAVCTPAQAGFDSAETPDVDYSSLPGSRMPGVARGLCAGSNVTPPQPGIWRFAVRGGAIMCPNAGDACTTTMPGICAAGRLQCGATGATTCAPSTPPRPKQCNGLDNDCDGKIDDGPCPAGTSCDGTACVPSCIEGGCAVGQACSAGLCVEAVCQGVSCPPGQRCAGGNCTDPCAGVTCPTGQACRAGACGDPCAGLDCGMGQVCEQGLCKAACPCRACMAAQTCEVSGPSAGQCVETACATLSCPTGRVCKGGSCVDPCTGATCPGGQVCRAGACVARPVVDAGADSGIVFVLPEAGAFDAGTNGREDAGDGSASVDEGGVGTSGGWGSPRKSGGCGCTSQLGGGAGWGAALAVVLAAARRRRRTRPIVR